MKRFIIACLALLALAIPVNAAVSTTQYSLTNSGWTDLGAGPIQLSFTGGAVYLIADTIPTAPANPLGAGFAIASGASATINTASHVWAMATGSANATAYAAPILTSASIVFYGTYTGNVAITAGATTAVIIDNVVVDTFSGWSTGANTYTAKVPGWYRICAYTTTVSTVAAGPLNDIAIVKKSGANIGVTNFGVPTGTTVYVPMTTCAVALMNGSTDTLSAALLPNATATANRMYGATTSTMIEISRISS